MKKNFIYALAATALFAACDNDDSQNNSTSSTVDPSTIEDYSVTPNFLETTSEFSDLKITSLLSSEDVLPGSPNFIYGSMADGSGMFRDANGQLVLINNIEADFAISRIYLDDSLKPVKGEYIVNSDATGDNAQCSGSLAVPAEHGYGPTYFSGGEWNGDGSVFVIDPLKDASTAGNPSGIRYASSMGEWTTENAVPLAQKAYEGKTIVMIGDDSHREAGGQVAMYMSETAADLTGGKLFGLKVGDGTMTDNELAVAEGPVEIEFVEYLERTYDALNEESMNKNIMDFNRIEDIDYRKGDAAANREIYIVATGRNQYNDRRSQMGRIYKLVLDENNPLKGTIEVVVDGDDLNGPAGEMHSPDNILVTDNYAYIQEDPNGYYIDPKKEHDARVYQYNLNTGEFKTVLEIDQQGAMVSTTDRFGTQYAEEGDRFGACELTGMIDISDVTGFPDTFLLIIQAHTWNNPGWSNPDGGGVGRGIDEGSIAYIIQGLDR